MKFAVITPSYRGDHALCVELCRSFDRFAADGIDHVLVVPRRDLALFSPLANARRTVIVKEDVLPRWIVTVPFPPVVRLPFIGTKRMRTLWVTPRLRPVRGWILQQIVKLSADRFTDADVFVFIDSDGAFVRPFGPDTICRDGKVLLHYEPDCIERSLDLYAGWQNVACDLIGVPHYPYARDNYITGLAVWRRDRLVELQRRIEETSGMDFRAALVRCRHLSEYVLYGVYCDRLAEGDGGHYRHSPHLVLLEDALDVSREDDVERLLRDMLPSHVVVLIQSTSAWTLEARRRAIAAAQALA